MVPDPKQFQWTPGSNTQFYLHGGLALVSVPLPPWMDQVQGETNTVSWGGHWCHNANRKELRAFYA